MSIQLPLFWSTWSQARGQDLATSGMCWPLAVAWRMGVITAFVELRANVTKEAWQLFLLALSRLNNT